MQQYRLSKLQAMHHHIKITILLCLSSCLASAQGIHFSQYFNAPQLLNPANTALIATEDFSLGAQYREQWANIPAPFKTIAAHADMQLMRNKNLTNWLGLGFGFFSDKAGQGILSNDRIQASLAYHVQLDDYNMISAGATVAYVNRSVDFNRLNFDVQWDGFTYNTRNSSQEPYVRQKTSYADVSLGLNYAYFPSDNFYLKVGAGLMHLNRPKESFYNENNRLGIRPMGNVDLLLKAGERFIINPSIYYANQKKASELVFGSLFNAGIALEDGAVNSVIWGLYYRLGESFIPVVGLEWSRLKMMVSYDITASGLSSYNRSQGAIECALIFKGFYGNISRGRSNFNCPRF